MRRMSGVEQQPEVVPGLVPGEDLQPPAGGFLQTLEKVEELFGQSFVFQRLCRTLGQFFWLKTRWSGDWGPRKREDEGEQGRKCLKIKENNLKPTKTTMLKNEKKKII